MLTKDKKKKKSTSKMNYFVGIFKILIYKFIIFCGLSIVFFAII